MRLRASVLIALCMLTAPGGAVAQDAADVAARSLESDPVYVHPGALDRLSVPDQGRVRIKIAREALGRMKVVVVPSEVAGRAGGVGGFANAIDRSFDVRGTMIVVAGSDYYAVTSYPDSDAAADALRKAVVNNRGDGLGAQLLEAVERIAKVDPGPGSEPAVLDPDAVGVPDADGFFDDILDTFRIVGLIIASAIALPFVLLAMYLVIRYRRRRVRQNEEAEHGERTVRDELVTLGEGIQSLDIDTSMPNADRQALADYEQAIARYDQANDLLIGDPSDYQVQQARAAIDAGKRHIEAARRRLEAETA